MATRRTQPRPRWRPHVEALEHRDCPSVSIVQNGSTLQITGDDANNVIAVADLGPDGVKVGAGKAAPVTYKGVSTVTIAAGAGDDDVKVSAPGAGGNLTVTVGLGAGDDKFMLCLIPAPPPPGGGTGGTIPGGTTGTPPSGGSTPGGTVGTSPGSGGSTGGTTGAGGSTGAGGTVATKLSASFGGTTSKTTTTGGTGTTGTSTSTTPPPPGTVQVTVTGGDGNDAAGVSGVAPPGPAGSKLPAFLRNLNVSFDGGGGDDKLGSQFGGMTFQGKTGLTLNGGAGNDGVAVDGKAAVFGPLNITASGGAGNDMIRVGFDAGPSPLGPDGKPLPPLPPTVFNGAVQVNVSGDDGDDAVSVALGAPPPPQAAGSTAGTITKAGGPVVNGSFTFQVDGGAGKDKLDGFVAVSPDSKGQVGIKFRGGDGDDLLALNVVGLPDAKKLFAGVDGGAGTDTARTKGTVDVAGVESLNPTS